MGWLMALGYQLWQQLWVLDPSLVNGAFASADWGKNCETSCLSFRPAGKHAAVDNFFSSKVSNPDLRLNLANQ